jgi:hypothetical protein
MRHNVGSNNNTQIVGKYIISFVRALETGRNVFFNEKVLPRYKNKCHLKDKKIIQFVYQQYWSNYNNSTYVKTNKCWLLCLKVFSANFNTISVVSWWSVLLVEETGGPSENHRPVASHWQTLSHNVIHLALIEIWTHNISCDMHWLHR